jgi:hypothetical protein
MFAQLALALLLSTPDASPPAKETPSKKLEPHSWWCTTSLRTRPSLPERTVCISSEESCIALADIEDNIGPEWSACQEYKGVTIFSYTTINGRRLTVGFPLVSQCQRFRKNILKQKVDFKDVSKCHSSLYYSDAEQ